MLTLITSLPPPRYFVLQGKVISYYADERDNRPRRTIDLSHCVVRSEGTKKGGTCHVFCLYLTSEVLNWTVCVCRRMMCRTPEKEHRLFSKWTSCQSLLIRSASCDSDIDTFELLYNTTIPEDFELSWFYMTTGFAIVGELDNASVDRKYRWENTVDWHVGAGTVKCLLLYFSLRSC